MHYGKKVSNDSLVSIIKQIAHRFDHRFMRGTPINSKDVFEIEYLLALSVKRGIKFDDSMMWALGLYSLAKLNATNSYILKEKEKRDSNYSSILSGIIKNRRSVRKWNSNEVDLQLVRDIIGISLWAPSSCNRQPVRVIVLDDEQKDFIKKYFPGTFWHSAPVQILVLCNSDIYSDNEIYFLYLDGGAFIQNMTLLLHEAGLGACWLGFKKWNVKRELFCDIEEFNDFYEYFNIDKDLIPLSMVVVGEYNHIPNTPARHGLDTIILGCDKK